MKHADVIEKMTLEEKAAILSGKTEWQSRNIDRLAIPSILCADGPHGLRRQMGAGDHLGLNASLPATCFPTAATIANSFDISLAEEVGRALGEEAAAQEVDILLGPGLNIKRSPLCGRNFEYFSEDPYLSGKMAAAYIKGIQSCGVYACPKHFAVNSRELRRMATNSVLDERTLREIYLEGFEMAVKEGSAKSLMTSYNEVNGTYSNENEHLLKDILRDEWGFDGIVVTDWGGSNDHVRAVSVEANLEMPDPGLDSAREVVAAVKEGRLRMGELDNCVDHLLDAVFTLTGKKSARKKEGCKGFDEAVHHALARKAAQESIVMLKNTSGSRPLLPLKENCGVALIGDFARIPRYQGAGSSMVNPIEVETMENQIHEYSVNLVGYAGGYRRTGESDELLKKSALDLAVMADVVIYCFGLNELGEAEGMDRSHMRIPQNQIELLEALVSVNANIVGVLSAGSSIEMPWQHCCKAILHGYLGGQAGAGAMLNVLTGKVNPSGRLNETYPLCCEDTPAFRNDSVMQRNLEYRESIFVGYRYYDTCRVKVQYPFGYGLSYTSFEYAGLEVNEEGAEFVITNTGSRDGAEVAQLYIGGPKGHIFRPDKELKGFVKVFLKVKESRKMKIPFDDKTFRYWNVSTNRWEIEGGAYTVKLGANAADIRLAQEICIEGTTKAYPYVPEEMPRYFSGHIQEVSDKEFEKLLQQKLPDGRWSGELGINDAVCQMYYAKSGLARFICRQLTRMKRKSEKKGKPDLNILFIYNMPFRGIAKMTGGMVSMEMVRGMVLVVNGHFLKGMKKIAAGFFANKRANKQYEQRLMSH